MGSPEILSAKAGINVMSRDTTLRADEVRDAVNVVLHKDGGWKRRPGTSKAITLSAPRCVFTSDYGHTYVVSGSNLYEVTPDLTTRELYSNVWTTGVSYCDHAGGTYASVGDLIRIFNGVVSTAGVMPLTWFTPTLTAGTGGLDVGTYTVAISAVNAYGEESGLSGAGSIPLALPGSITLTLPTATSEVHHWNIYRSSVNGAELYLADTAPANASSHTLNEGELGQNGEHLWQRVPLPAGTYLREYRGRLYSAVGSFLFYTDAHSHLTDVRSGMIPFGETITSLLPVDDGIYVGLKSGSIFLSGNQPGEFTYLRVQDSGAFPGSGALVSGDFFGLPAVKVAVWLSPIGYQLGANGGKLTTPQSTRVRLPSTTRAITTPVVLNGVKQLVSAVDTLTLGGAGANYTTP